MEGTSFISSLREYVGEIVMLFSTLFRDPAKYPSGIAGLITRSG